jgi:hypothetical protein
VAGAHALTDSRFSKTQAEGGPGGSFIFPRVVAISTPIPTRMIAPTRIHIEGTFNRYAAIARPTIRMKKPMRYVPNEDIALVR